MARNRSFLLAILSWKFLFSRNPKDAIRGILGFLRDRPVAIYLLAICILHPSLIGIPIIILGFLFSQLILWFASSRRNLANKLKALYGGVMEIEKEAGGEYCIKKYLVSDYLKWQYADINKYLFQRFMGLLGINSFTLDNTIHVYHVQIKDRIFQNLSCYPSLLSSYIFFNKPPSDKIGSFQRFSFLHELFHASLQMVSGSPFASNCLTLYAIYFLFLFFLVQWTIATSIVIILMALLILFALIEKLVINRERKLKDEVFADGLALCYLDEHERRELGRLLENMAGFFYDKSLSFNQNKFRLQLLQKNLELIALNNEDEVMNNTFSHYIKPSFHLLILTSAITIIPAYYSKHADSALLIYLCIATCTLFFLTRFLNLSILGLHRVIIERLSNMSFQDESKLVASDQDALSIITTKKK